MTDLTPADLARFIHPVPVGARFPIGLEVMEFSRTGGYFRGPFRYTRTCHQLADEPPRWTAEPLTAPVPPLPTEVGAVIANASWRHSADTCAGMMLLHGSWVGSDQDGDIRHWCPDEITDWTAARVVADGLVGEPSVRVNSLKMAREALCVAEHMMLKGPATPAQIGQIGAMITDIDRQRPVGPDGKHGSRHTATCGCEDR